MNEIAVRRVERTVQQSIEPQSGPRPASKADIIRFQEIMKREPMETILVQETAQTMQTARVQQADQAVKTPGDSILDSLDRISAEHNVLKEQFISAAGNGEMGYMVNLQLDIARITTTQTLLGKVGEKAGQGINQLVRGQ